MRTPQRNNNYFFRIDIVVILLTTVIFCMIYKVTKSIFISSLILNVLLIIIVMGGGIYHRAEVYNFFVHLIANFSNDHISEDLESTPNEIVLSCFNNNPLEALNDSIMVGSDTTITCLFLGNSLTYHDAPEEEIDKTKRGLTSTCLINDYVHILLKKISDEKYVNIKFSILNIAEFERTFREYSFSFDKLHNAVVKQPDYLIVQIGENVTAKDSIDVLKYENEFIKLLNLFPKSKRIITIPFWPRKELQYATTNVAIKSNSYLVDISHLGNGTDSNNFSSSYKTYKQAGVGSHPGDYGMRNIANCIYAIFNASY